MEQVNLIPLRRALISVSDKTGLADFAGALVREFAVKLISTGGTARWLQNAGLSVRDVADLTGFPEMMDGRVKTLHPKIHGGLLAVRDNPEHRAAMQAQGIEPIDLVVINLYPFEETISKSDCSLEQAIENIDIGGPAMIRSAAKNHCYVTAITDPSGYEQLLKNLRKNNGSTDMDFRFQMAAAAFDRTARYDSAIARYLSDRVIQQRPALDHQSTNETFAQILNLSLRRQQVLRYGENPHQSAALYSSSTVPSGLCAARQLHGKALSYLNLLDADAAMALVNEFESPAAAIIKHANPCGCAVADALSAAFELAYAGDPAAAFGGILAVNRPIDGTTAEKIVSGKRFIEVILAPDYEPRALQLLRDRWMECRILSVTRDDNNEALDFRSIAGGMLVEQADRDGFDQSECKVVSGRQPTPQEREDLKFAASVCKYVKSNAITICSNGQLLAAGAGQMSRVTSCRLAVELAQLNGHAEKLAGAVAASDAFFPFPDGPEILINAGVKAIIQPGGSKKDDETIQLCNTRNVALVFTGRRHFRH
ncbi:MAG TPA: bifunctional phosphoribosylaminoimidazolecarboxamide formyltransferase/IMP cyclohydrolase [Phycisphaerae bacterium]|nr:bifunctional phosphoribosylaminoimidazolecarboxamide formyltransferase/IMP cyclohydrolase [Phycisphaerae bacterium]